MILNGKYVLPMYDIETQPKAGNWARAPCWGGGGGRKGERKKRERGKEGKDKEGRSQGRGELRGEREGKGLKINLLYH